MVAAWCMYLLLLSSKSYVQTAPAHTDHNGLNPKSDLPVQELEKLKNGYTDRGHMLTLHGLTDGGRAPASLSQSAYDHGQCNLVETLAESSDTDKSSTHVEYHRLDAVQANGELVSRLEEHGTADAVGGEKPRVHAQAQLDVPSEDVHRVLVQDGSHVSVHDVTAPTTVASEETTPKIFHGAARLVQPGSSTNNNPLSTHTAIRRAFNNDFTKQTKNTIDRYGTYTSGGIPYSPMDMAEYVFWTGDERGVTTVIEDFLLEGMMSKEDAINFLQEIKFNIDFLRAHYTQNLKAAEEKTQQDKLRNMLIEQANAGEYQYRSPALQSLQFGNNPDLMRNLVLKNWDMNNNLSPIPSLPVTSDRRPEPFKRTYDPRMQMNYMGASDYERDGQMNAEEEYDEIMERLKPADPIYPEYTLEIIYQLAKMMFSQSLFQDPAAARAATQQFMTFLELEAEKGQMSRSIEKKVLDVMIAALTDTIADHPDLLQSHDTFTIPTNRRMSPYFKPSPPEPGMSRAVLAAFKDELLKGLTQRKFSYTERN